MVWSWSSEYGGDLVICGNGIVTIMCVLGVNVCRGRVFD